MSRITFGGLASGLDTNTMINQLIELERQPIVQKEQRIQVLEQVKDAWRDINMRLRHLRSTVQELSKKENILSKQAVSTNTSYVQATADSSAENATYELKVNKLATNHTVAMNSDIQTLLGRSKDEAMGLTGNFVLNGVEIEVESGDSLEDLKNTINNSAAEVEASIIAGHLILKSQTSGLEGAMAMSYASGDDVLDTLKICESEGGFYNKTLPVNHMVSMQSDIESLLGIDATESMGLAGIFAINGVQIEVEIGDSLEALRDKINSSAAGVVASINAGQLILESQTSGPEGVIAISYISGDDLLNTLKIYDSRGVSYYKETLKAQDAEFSINGISVTRSSNEVNDLIDGVTFRLYGGGAESVYVKISTDTEKAVAAVAAFVEQYNSVHTFIREKLEKPDKDQSESSTVGLLQGDTTLMKIERNLRSLVSSPVSNFRYETEEGWKQKEYYCFASLGVTTIDKEGYLQFDPEKLVSALEDDPEAVFEVLKFEIKDEYGAGTGQFDGLGVTLDNYLKRLLIAEQDSMGRTLYPISVREEEAVQRRIDELQRQIEVREERLLRYEERLITQFAALEKYIAEMQSQSQDFENLVNQLVGFGSSKK